MGRYKLPDDPRRRKQVKTFIGKHGREKYSEIGRRNGKPTPASFDSERGRAAANRMWEKRRAAQAAESEKNNEPTNQETQ